MDDSDGAGGGFAGSSSSALQTVVYYDLTTFIAHRRYADSELMDFGFAHNTPSNKRKFKLGLDTLADGNIP